MNLMRSVLVFVSILYFSPTVRSEEWTKREWEPVNRDGVANLSRRRIKGSKSAKSDKSGKSNKKYSKKEKGFLDEDIANDFNDLFESYLLHHSSLGSMPLKQAQPLSTNTHMMELELADGRYSPTPSEDDIRISFAQFSLTFSLAENDTPTKRNDYIELLAATESTFKAFMVRSYASNSISYLKDFEVEFVKTGMTQLDEIFVVFQSTAIFDSAFPGEPSRVQSTLSDGLTQDQTLWMEYVTSLQELNPDNAFSSTVGISYTESIPNGKGNDQSTMSTADMIAYSAAACITLLSTAAFLVKRSGGSHDKFDSSPFFEKSMGSKMNSSCQSTVAETLTCASSSTYGKPNQLDFDNEDEEVGETRKLYTHESHDHRTSWRDQNSSSIGSATDDDSIHEAHSERISGTDKGKADSYRDRKRDNVQESCNQIVSGNHHVYDDKLSPGNALCYSLQERQSKQQNRPNSVPLEAIAQHNDSDESKVDIHCQGSRQINIQLESDRAPSIGGYAPQDQSALTDDRKKILMAQEYLQALLQDDEISQSDEECQFSQDMLQAELESILAEEAAREADEERLKARRTKKKRRSQKIVSTPFS